MADGRKNGATGAAAKDSALARKLLSQRVDALAAVSEQLDTRSDKLRRQLVRLDSTQNELSGIADALARRVGEIAAKNGELQQEFAATRDAAQQVERRLQGQLQAMAPSEERLSQALQRLSGLDQQQQRTAEAVSNLDHGLNELGTRLAEAAKRTSELSSTLRDLKGDKSELEGLAATLGAARGELDGFAERLRMLEAGDENAADQQQIKDRLAALEADLRAGLADSAAPLRALNERVAELAEAQQAMQARYTAIDAQSARLQASIDEAIATEQAARDDWLAQAAAYAQRLKRLEDEWTAADVPNLETRLQALSASNQELQAAFQSEREQRDSEATTQALLLEELSEQIPVAQLLPRIDALDAATEGLEKALEAEREERRTDVDLQRRRLQELAERVPEEDLEYQLQSLHAALQSERAQRDSEATTQALALEELSEQLAPAQLLPRIDALDAATEGLEEALETERAARRSEAATREEQLNALRERIDSDDLPEQLEALRHSASELADRLSDEAGQRADLQTETTVQAQRLQSVEQRIEAVDALRLAQRLQALDERLDDAVQANQAQNRQLGEAMHGVGQLKQRAESLAEQLDGLNTATQAIAQLRDSAQATRAAQEEQRGALAELRGGLIELTQELAADAGSIGKQAQRLDRCVSQVEADSEQLRALAEAQTALREELQGLAGQQATHEARWGDQETRSAEDRQRLHARLQELEQAMTALKEAGQRQDDRVAETVATLNTLGDAGRSIGDKLASLEALEPRLARLEDQRDPLSAHLHAHDEEFGQLKTRLQQLESHAGELSGRLSEEAERVAGRLAELAELDARMEQNRADISATVNRLDDVAASAQRREREHEDSVNRMAGLEQQGHRQGEELEQNRERFNYLESTQDNANHKLGSLERQASAQEARLVQTRSGQRLMAGIGIAAALALLVLSVVSYVFMENRREVDRGAVMQELERVEQRIAKLRTGAPEAARDLSRDMADLRLQIRTLFERYDRLPDAASAQHLDAINRHRDNLVQAIDDMGQRLAQLESAAPAQTQAPTSQPAPVPIPAAPAVSPAAIPAAVALPEVRRDPWAAAQRRRHFTLQLLGVRERASLLAFVKRHRLSKLAGWLRTEHQGRPWYVLFYGRYPSAAAARRGADQVADTLPNIKPWVRRLPATGDIHSVNGSP